MFDYFRVVRKDDSFIKDMIYENLNSQNKNYNLEVASPILKPDFLLSAAVQNIFF